MSWEERATPEMDPSRIINDVIVHPSVGPLISWLITLLVLLVIYFVVIYGSSNIIAAWARFTAIIVIGLVTLVLGWAPIVGPRLRRYLLPRNVPSWQSYVRNRWAYMFLFELQLYTSLFLRIIIHIPSKLISLVDYLLARPIAILAGTKIGDWLPVSWHSYSVIPRYSILLAWLGGMTYGAYTCSAPYGLYFFFIGVVIILAVVRRWNWVERDRQTLLDARKHDEGTERIGFSEDLRDEALTSIAFLFILIPLGLRQIYLVTCNSGQCAFVITGLAAGKDPPLLSWFSFFGGELVKSIPLVDWAEVFQVENGSIVKPATQLGVLTVFLLRAALDLLFFAAVLQAIQIAYRSAAHKKAFWAGDVDFLDPFTKRTMLEKVIDIYSRYDWLSPTQAVEATWYQYTKPLARARLADDQFVQIILGRHFEHQSGLNRASRRALAVVSASVEARGGALAILALQSEVAALELISDHLASSSRSKRIHAIAVDIALASDRPEAIPALENLLTYTDEQNTQATLQRAINWHKGNLPPWPNLIYRPQMIRIELGKFVMGSPEDEPGRFRDEGPQREVIITRAFELGKYAVTFEEYDMFCDATGRCKTEDKGWGRGCRPVINLTWEDAYAYCQWLNEQTGDRFRLPTEAEWEYACRAGTTTLYSFGDTISTDLANYDGNWTFNGSNKGEYRKQTLQVGSLPANPWGLYEMHGNVWEWCFDPWHFGYEWAPKSELPWIHGGNLRRAVIRGGGWGDFPQGLRSANRSWASRRSWIDAIGFRLAKTLRHDGN
jgi:formylglycine-generating enzyme required for sulfatase activity